MEIVDYPALKALSLDTYFQEELVTLYFFSVRSCSSNLLLLAKRLNTILERLQENCVEYSNYIHLFYKLVLHIRKIGEHDLTYMMIWEWNYYFPAMSKQLIEECLNWRDIVYFCHYIISNLQDRKSRGEALIDYCVSRINKQFISDMEIWRFSTNAGSLNHISNVAKWIPRENKRFSWLYELLVIDWIKRTSPYLLSTTTRSSSYDAAILKGKRLYRKKVATLNKALQTIQIKQCSKQIQDIQPNMITKYTAIKQSKLVDDVSKNKNYKCSREPCFSRSEISNGIKQYHHLSIAYFVKSVLESTQVSSSINSEWLLFTKQILSGFSRTLPESLFLPILDISYKMQYESLESYYTAIGIAIFLAQQGSSMRILAIRDRPIWIQLNKNMPFTECVQTIQHLCGGYHSSQIDLLVTLINKGLNETGLVNAELNIPTLILLSDYSTSTFSEFHKKITCKIIYWNLSSRYLIENLDQIKLPCSTYQTNVVCVSGFSISPTIFEFCNDPYNHLIRLLE